MTRTLQTICVLSALLLPGAALAGDAVKTTQRTPVMARPGEASHVLTRLSEGRRLEVIGQQGRWYKVKVNGTTGWVTRSSVEPAEEGGTTRRAREESTRKTRRVAFVEGRSTRRGWSGGAPEDRTGEDAISDEADADADETGDDDADAGDDRDDDAAAPARASKPKHAKPARRVARVDDDEVSDRDDRDDRDADAGDGDDGDDGDGDRDEQPTVVVTSGEARVFAEASARSGVEFTAGQGDRLTVIRRSGRGRWILVENDDGKAGWVRAANVRDGAAGYPYPRLAYRATGGIGYTALGMTYVSDGVGPLANYAISSAAATVAIGGQVLYSGYGPHTLLGGDLTYRGSRASPGIRYVDADGTATDIAFLMHEVDLGARAGYRTSSPTGLALFARLGYHYGNFAVADVSNLEHNLARIPSETLKGITAGASIEAPRLRDKIAAQLGVDVLYPGSRVQTAGLEDGASSKVRAGWATARVTYALRPQLQLEAGYRYFWSKTEWTGMAPASQRMNGATAASRTDVVHTLTVGLGKTF